ncbi:MAG: type I-E CRISPR-associated protein Cse1/CasA [Mycobacteriaceae bacterium]
MVIKEFNLLAEPWILVQRLDGSRDSLSITEVFKQAGSIRVISGDIPTQAFAITRVLLAILYRAIEWEEPVEEHWGKIWEKKEFPISEIQKYLDEYRHRFDLLHHEEPFFQVADLHTAKGEFTSLERIIADVPPNEKYFATRAGEFIEKISYAEAARWVVHCQAFDASGIRSGDPRDKRVKSGRGYPIGVAWSGQLGGVIFEGASLFETLMLNLVLKNSDGEAPSSKDTPVWEREQPGPSERADPTPLGTIDLLTWQSRRLRLDHDGEKVCGVLIANGDAINSHNRFKIEFLSPWRYSEPQTKKFGETRYLPKQHDPERALWRGIEALLSDVDDPKVESRKSSIAPGVAHWLQRLSAEDLLEDNLIIRPHSLGLHYVSQSSVVEESIDDTLSMSVALLGRKSEHRQYAVKAVRAADAAAKTLADLAGNLAQAAGGEPEGVKGTALAQAFFELDSPYRAWLATLKPDTDLVGHFAMWQKKVRSIIGPRGKDLVEAAGRPAFIGRMVKEKHLDASIAYKWFWMALGRELPLAFDKEMNN